MSGPDDFYQSVACPLCTDKTARQLYKRERFYGSDVGKTYITVQQCERCGFIYNSPRISDKELTKYYQKSILASGQIFRSNLPDSYYQKLHARRANFFADILAGCPSVAPIFLDIGSGYGDFLQAMKATLSDHWRFEAIEPSEHACAVLNEKGFAAHCGYLSERTEFATKYQALSLVSVLEHVGDPLTLLRSIKQCCANGAFFYIEVPNTLKPELSLTGCFGLEHICHFTPFTLAQALLEMGWTHGVIDSNTNHNLRMVVSDADFENALALSSIDDDRAEVYSTVQAYVNKEDAFLENLKARVGARLQLWKNQGKKVALYCAGQHSIELSSWINYPAYIDYVFDGDKVKQGSEFMGFTVLAPEEMARLPVDACLISSGRFVDEIRQTIQKYNANTIEIIDCYNDEAEHL